MDEKCCCNSFRRRSAFATSETASRFEVKLSSVMHAKKPNYISAWEETKQNGDLEKPKSHFRACLTSSFGFGLIFPFRQALKWRGFCTKRSRIVVFTCAFSLGVESKNKWLKHRLGGNKKRLPKWWRMPSFGSTLRRQMPCWPLRFKESQDGVEPKITAASEDAKTICSQKSCGRYRAYPVSSQAGKNNFCEQGKIIKNNIGIYFVLRFSLFY